MWKWWFRGNAGARLAGQFGAFGDEAKKQADEVAEEQAIALIFIVVIGVIGYGCYLLLQVVGLL